jgi:hypothetical protein
MKTLLRRSVPLACLAALALFPGCSKSDTDSATAKVKDAYQDSKDAIVDTWKDVKSYTFEKRSDFSTEAKAQMAQVDANVARLQAKEADSQASASRKAAWDDLKSSEADYKSKLDALGTATADTWDSGKQNVVSAWDHVKASYDKARAD